MKVTLVVLGLTCFIGALQALPLQENFNKKDEIGTFIGIEPQTFPNFEKEIVEDRKPSVRLFGKSTEELDSTRPPQVHHNAFRSQGPLSGKLTNIVFNKKGNQKTVQRNRIEYSLNGDRRAMEILEDSKEANE